MDALTKMTKAELVAELETAKQTLEKLMSSYQALTDTFTETSAQVFKHTIEKADLANRLDRARLEREKLEALYKARGMKIDELNRVLGLRKKDVAQQLIDKLTAEKRRLLYIIKTLPEEPGFCQMCERHLEKSAVEEAVPAEEQFEDCPHAGCVCARMFNEPATWCLEKMPEAAELRWKKKIMD